MKPKRLIGSTTLLANDEQVMIVDVSDDLRRVVVMSPLNREEGTPENARAFVRRLRQQHGQIVEELCTAIERAADRCVPDDNWRPS